MQSKASTVDEYLLAVPADRIAAMKQLRKLFLRELKGFAEKMVYGGPAYERNGVVEAGFVSQKHFIGVYILKQHVFKKFIHELEGVTYGKGVIRFTNLDKINYQVIQKMLRATCESTDIICGK
ncbi:MAG: iron chaperone [Bacteroidia bacterium]